jgi:hypothetical protein
MTYKISFNALKATDEVVGSATLTIITDKPLQIQKKSACFHRMCVEYARLIGMPCSFAEIISVEGGDLNG